MESVQKTDDGKLSEGSNPSASATALILCGIRAGEGFFFCFSLRISDPNGVNGRVFLIVHALAIWQIAPNGIGFYQTKAEKAHDFNRGMKGRTLELLWEKFQSNSFFVYIHVFVTTWHLKYDIIDT